MIWTGSWMSLECLKLAMYQNEENEVDYIFIMSTSMKGGKYIKNGQ